MTDTKSTTTTPAAVTVGAGSKLTWGDWRKRAERFAAGLQRHGIEPGDTVAALFGNSADSCAAVLGTWLAGARVVSLPLISRGMRVGAYHGQLASVLSECSPGIVASDSTIVGMLRMVGLRERVWSFDDLSVDVSPRPQPVADGAVAFVQYSSGSTSRPKGCQLTARAIAAQLSLLEEALDVDPERDHGAVWLPLSHDMGMFGGPLLSYWTRHPVAIGTPQRFVADPWSWVRDSEHFGATLSAMPNFALALLARIGAQRAHPHLRMRHVVVGGALTVSNADHSALCITVA